MAVKLSGNSEELFKGCVIDLFERNLLDDSDFYAVCWDKESKSVVNVEYDTTRFGGYGEAWIDATDDVLREVYRFYWNSCREKFDMQINEADAKRFSVGDEVIVTRGRKVKPGTVGKVFWMGTTYNPYSYRNEKRVGIENAGQRSFLSVDYVENANWEKRMLTGKARKQRIRDLTLDAMPHQYRYMFDSERRKHRAS